MCIRDSSSRLLRLPLYITLTNSPRLLSILSFILSIVIIYLGYPIYIIPLVIIPPIPLEPYLVLSKILIKSIFLFLSEKARLEATIAGSSA